MTRSGNRRTTRLAVLTGLFAFLAVPVVHGAGSHAYGDGAASERTSLDAGGLERLLPAVAEFCPLCLMSRQARALAAGVSSSGVSVPASALRAARPGALAALPRSTCLAPAAPRGPPRSA